MTQERVIFDARKVIIPDDRGKTRLCSFFWNRHSGPNAVSAEDAAWLREAANAVAVWGAVYGGCAALIMLLANRSIGSWLQYPALGVAVIACWVFWDLVFLRVKVRPIYRERFRRIALKRGLCPWCCYGLMELHAEDDGCVCCPECGGAWRKEDIGAEVARSGAGCISSPKG